VRIRRREHATHEPLISRAMLAAVPLAGLSFDLLQADVGVAAQVLKALVGDVVVEKRQIEGQKKPQMVARFTINAVPALAVLDRGQAADGDESQASMWGSLHADRKNTSTRPLDQEEVLVPLPRKMPRQQ
jgi:hypothetical protein